MGPEQVKNSKSRFQTNGKIPSENEGKSSDFAPYGMPVKKKHSVLLRPNSNGGARIHATAWRTVATSTVMINRLMANAA
jgi:hypothetical protein